MECDDVIYSRARQDFRYCSCGQVSVEGGREYFKYGNAPGADFKITEVNVNVPLNELYEDWDQMVDNYGVIHAA